MEYQISTHGHINELEIHEQAVINSEIVRNKLSIESVEDYEGWLVARELGSQAIVGFVAYERRDENVYMQSLVVPEEHRRHGIGANLTEALFDELYDGDTLVALTMFWNNRFYAEQGFEMTDAKTIKEVDDVAGKRKHKYCTAWVKQKIS